MFLRVPRQKQIAAALVYAIDELISDSVAPH